MCRGRASSCVDLPFWGSVCHKPIERVHMLSQQPFKRPDRVGEGVSQCSLISFCSRFNNGWIFRYFRKYSCCNHFRSRGSRSSPKEQYTSYTTTPQLLNQYHITPDSRVLADIAQTYSRYVETRSPCWKTTWCPSKFEVHYTCLV